ncbi:hypothetical protein BT69DRAFT_1014623 [Atractiella rhizophila]|nr:hypothetical protein BT69DRAFT_1014623 [Atractiella rhizophila]
MQCSSCTKRGRQCEWAEGVIPTGTFLKRDIQNLKDEVQRLKDVLHEREAEVAKYRELEGDLDALTPTSSQSSLAKEPALIEEGSSPSSDITQPLAQRHLASPSTGHPNPDFAHLSTTNRPTLSEHTLSPPSVAQTLLSPSNWPLDDLEVDVGEDASLRDFFHTIFSGVGDGQRPSTSFQELMRK